jgi:hypothetical protein
MGPNMKLKTLIMGTGLPQVYWAGKIGISEAKFSKIIRGWVEPKEEEKKKIAAVLNCRVEDFF